MYKILPRSNCSGLAPTPEAERPSGFRHVASTSLPGLQHQPLLEVMRLTVPVILLSHLPAGTVTLLSHLASGLPGPAP